MSQPAELTVSPRRTRASPFSELTRLRRPAEGDNVA